MKPLTSAAHGPLFFVGKHGVDHLVVEVVHVIVEVDIVKGTVRNRREELVALAAVRAACVPTSFSGLEEVRIRPDDVLQTSDVVLVLVRPGVSTAEHLSLVAAIVVIFLCESAHLALAFAPTFLSPSALGLAPTSARLPDRGQLNLPAGHQSCLESVQLHVRVRRRRQR